MSKTLDEFTAEIRTQMNRNPKASAYRIDARTLLRLLESADAELDAEAADVDRRGSRIIRPSGKVTP